MVGRSIDDLAPDLLDTFGDVALRLRGITVADPANPARLAVSGLDLDVHEGEIVCLYGLMGAGRTELLEALAGRVPSSAARVEVRGRVLQGESIAERIELGLALVPEDRQRDGLVQTMSVGENTSLASLLIASCEGSPSACAARRMPSQTADRRRPGQDLRTWRLDHRRCPAGISRRSSSARS